MASQAERHLRQLAVDRLRVVAPGARIVHELNIDTGRCRVDIAAIQPERLLFVEVKSRKDKLDRLKEQVRIFGPACHRLAICYASERWSWEVIRKEAGWSCDTWPDDKVSGWTFSNFEHSPPNSSAMLNLLWRDELHDEARRAGFQPHSRESRLPLINRLWRGLTGDEVVAAVCRQLRARSFAEADPPIFEQAEAG